MAWFSHAWRGISITSSWALDAVVDQMDSQSNYTTSFSLCCTCRWTCSTRTHTSSTTWSWPCSSATDPVTSYSMYSHGGHQPEPSWRITSRSWTTGSLSPAATLIMSTACRLASWTACQHVTVTTGPVITRHASTCWQSFSMAWRRGMTCVLRIVANMLIICVNVDNLYKYQTTTWGKLLSWHQKKRSVIVAPAKKKLSYSATAWRVGCSKASVGKTLKLFDETGRVFSRQRSGRPRRTTRRDDIAMLKAIKKQPFLSASDVKKEVPCVKVSLRTVRRHLCDEFNLRSRHAARKPLFNSKQVTKRLHFCRKYMNWTTAQWSRVMFSDEIMFCQFGTHLNRVRRPADMRYNRRFTVSIMKHPQKIMIWGCFLAKGRGSIFFIKPNETVNAKKYIVILDAKLPTVMSIHRATVFQQDGAPSHTAKVVRKWFKDKKLRSGVAG